MMHSRLQILEDRHYVLRAGSRQGSAGECACYNFPFGLRVAAGSVHFSIEDIMPNPNTRQEKDSIGTKDIPADVYYGIQTARAVENYPISGMRAHPTLILAIGMVKRAAAEANKSLGLVDDKRADAISQAAQEVADGKWNHQFVVDVF